MKNIKKTTALLIAMALCFGLSITGFAATKNAAAVNAPLIYNVATYEPTDGFKDVVPTGEMFTVTVSSVPVKKGTVITVSNIPINPETKKIKNVTFQEYAAPVKADELIDYLPVSVSSLDKDSVLSYEHLKVAKLNANKDNTVTYVVKNAPTHVEVDLNLYDFGFSGYRDGSVYINADGTVYSDPWSTGSVAVLANPVSKPNK